MRYADRAIYSASQMYAKTWSDSREALWHAEALRGLSYVAAGCGAIFAGVEVTYLWVCGAASVSLFCMSVHTMRKAVRMGRAAGRARAKLDKAIGRLSLQ